MKKKILKPIHQIDFINRLLLDLQMWTIAGWANEEINLERIQKARECLPFLEKCAIKVRQLNKRTKS